MFKDNRPSQGNCGIISDVLQSSLSPCSYPQVLAQNKASKAHVAQLGIATAIQKHLRLSEGAAPSWSLHVASFSTEQSTFSSFRSLYAIRRSWRYSKASQTPQASCLYSFSDDKATTIHLSVQLHYFKHHKKMRCEITSIEPLQDMETAFSTHPELRMWPKWHNCCRTLQHSHEACRRVAPGSNGRCSQVTGTGMFIPRNEEMMK